MYLHSCSEARMCGLNIFGSAHQSEAEDMTCTQRQQSQPFERVREWRLLHDGKIQPEQSP